MYLSFCDRPRLLCISLADETRRIRDAVFCRMCDDVEMRREEAGNDDDNLLSIRVRQIKTKIKSFTPTIGK